jgi:cell division protein FtsZ
VPLQIVEGVIKTAVTDLEGEINYKDFERPPAMRHSRRSAGGQVAAAPGNASEEYFDIPAFLRRQAD